MKKAPTASLHVITLVTADWYGSDSSWLISQIKIIETIMFSLRGLACVAWRFCRAGRTSGEHERRSREKKKNLQKNLLQLLPPQSPRGFSALTRLYYLATKTAMLRRLYEDQIRH